MDEPSRAGLTISGRPRSSGRPITCLAVVAAAAQQPVLRRRQALGSQTRLVMTLSMEMLEAITPDRCRDAQQLERALHRAVLAEAAVQRDEAALEALALELRQVALGRDRRRGRPRPWIAAP
jgi:hypothetical protein